MRSIFIIFNMILMVILASCGGYDSLGISDNSSKEAKRYEILRALDRGDYEYVIFALEGDPTYGGAFTEEEGRLNLAAAYLGKAGYDYVDIINELIDEKEDPSKSLIRAFAKRASGKTIASLNKALALYNEIKPNDCKSAQKFYEKEACFYYDLVSCVQATTGLALAIGGVIADNTTTNIAEAVEYWLTANETNCSVDVNQNNVPDGADISACAIEFGANLNGTDPSQYITTPYQCRNNATIKYINTVTFIKENNNFDFIYVKITVPAQGDCSGNKEKTEKILMTETEDKTYTPAITDGFCDTSFNPCNENESECYPCPVVVEENVLDMDEVILDSVNNVNEFLEIKKDICETNPEACLCDNRTCDNNTLESATDIQITDSTIITDYLLTQQ